LPGFDLAAYKAEITEQKEEKLLNIVAEIGVARGHYVEFKECIKNDLNLNPIVEALKSREFDTFYAYFNMKKHYNKAYLTKFDYKKITLARTALFKRQILSILNS